jgi:hypothetical protein
MNHKISHYDQLSYYKDHRIHAQFIIEDGFAVLNPMDQGENFAEKWNRPNGEGESIKKRFLHGI